MDRRAQDHARGAMPVDPRMGVEAFILGRDERVLHDLGDLVDLDERPPLQAELGDEASVDRVELRGLVRRVLGEDFDRRALVTATDQRPAGVEDANTEARDAGIAAWDPQSSLGVALVGSAPPPMLEWMCAPTARG